jgi:DNA-damage-inducible protein J
MLARAVLREKRIPFKITGNDDSFYGAKNQAILAKSIEDLEAGRGTVHELIEDEDD